MNDTSPAERLEKHKAVAAWLEYQLNQTRRTIADLEREAVEWERRREVAYRESRFTIQYPRDDDEPARLHRGACSNNPLPGNLIEAPEAVLKLRDQRVVPCKVCKPQYALHGTWAPDITPYEGA